jgi:PPP family 3-phenylpropionic acid transporter
MLMYLGAGLSILLFYAYVHPLFALAVMALFTFFQIGIEPLTWAIALEHADARGWRFGPLRMAGTIGFALMAVLVGYVFNRKLQNALFLYCGLSLLGVALVGLLPPVAGHQRGARRLSMVSLLKSAELVGLLAYGAVLVMTLTFYYSFFPIYYQSLGATPVLLGIAIFISALPEIVVLLFADRIFDRLGPRWMILIAGAVLAVRWLLFYLLRDPYWLLPVQVLHAFTFIIIFFAISNYINRNVPKELKASGQALYGLAIGGVARVVGALAGGYLAQWRGLRSAFLYCSLLVTAATAAFGAWTLTAGTRRARSGVNAGT